MSGPPALHRDAQPFSGPLTRSPEVEDLHPPVKKNPGLTRSPELENLPTDSTSEDESDASSDEAVDNITDQADDLALSSPRANPVRGAAQNSTRNVVSQTNVHISVMHGPLIFGGGNRVGRQSPAVEPTLVRPVALRPEQKEHVDQCLKSRREVEEDDLPRIANHIGSKWRDVAYGLKLNHVMLDGIEQDCETLADKVELMLYRWVQKYCERATVARLTKILLQNEQYDAIAALKP